MFFTWELFQNHMFSICKVCVSHVTTYVFAHVKFMWFCWSLCLLSDCPAILDHCEEGVSSFYISFFSFIVVGLVIMTAAVIIVTFKSNAKGVHFTQTNNNSDIFI